METKSSSFQRIIKTTGIFGSSQVVNILMGIIRVKVVAVLLGTVGVGIIGIYQSVIDLVRSFSGLGLDMGSISQIAKDDSYDDKTRVTHTISVFRRWFLLTAVIGSVSCILGCIPLSLWAFEDTAHALPIAALSIVVFMVAITAGRSVVLQGLRKISFMAKASVIESLVGLLIIIPAYYFWGIDGVIPVFILNSILVFLCVSHYYRKLKIQTVPISNKEAFDAGLHTLYLGIFIILSSIISTASMFVIRIYIAREMDIESVGLFQSAWSITSVYLALILGSTGSDIYPRLCAATNDNVAVKKLVNEHLYIVMLIGSPIIIAMLILPEFTLSVLYSSKFSAAKAILLWQVIGSFFKLLSSPIASILLAKNKGILYFVSEFIFYLVYLGISYLALPHMGIAGVGIGYMAAYIIYWVAIIIMCRCISGFTWQRDVAVMMLTYALLIGLTAYVAIRCQGIEFIVCSALLLGACAGYSLYKFRKIFSIADIKGWLGKR